MASLEPGDIVQIKSGGPIMTVVSIDEAGAHCLWYSESGEEIRTATIPAVALTALVLSDDEDFEDDDFDDEEEEDDEEDKRRRSGKKR